MQLKTSKNRKNAAVQRVFLGFRHSPDTLWLKMRCSPLARFRQGGETGLAPRRHFSFPVPQEAHLPSSGLNRPH
jgi:hypothetical protein